MVSSEVPSSVIREFYDGVPHLLNELAWSNNYPVNEKVGRFCFLEAFRENGFDYVPKDNLVTLTGLREVGGRPRSLQATISFDGISRGWEHNVPSSPRALYNGIDDVFDQFIPDGASSEFEAFWNLRQDEPRKIRDSLEDLMKGYFALYHEHLLVPVDSKSVDLHPYTHHPNIVYELNEKLFPWPLLASAMRLQDINGIGISMTPTVGTLITEYPDFDPSDFLDDSTDVFKSSHQIALENRQGNIGNSYHPSIPVLEELYYGMYLALLAEEKGYKYHYSNQTEKENLVDAAVSGASAFKDGRKMFPTAS